MNEKPEALRLLSEIDWGVAASLEDPLEVRDFQILRVGEFYDPRYGKFQITAEMLAELKSNFDRNVLQVEVALDVNHEPEKGATAWLKELQIKGDGLWAKFKDFTNEGRKVFLEKIFRYFSVEMAPLVQVVEGKKQTIKNVLRGIALTNRPVVKGMQPTFLSEEVNQGLRPKTNMNAVMLFAENLLARAKVGTEDVAALKTMAVALSEDEKKEAEAKVAEVEAKAAADAKAEAEAKAAEGEEGDKALSETKTALATEQAARKLAEGKLAEKEAAEALSLAEQAYEGLILSDKNLTGFARKAAETAGVKDFVASLSEEQRTKFSEIVKAVQTVDKAELAEIGHGEAKKTDGASEEDQKLAEVDVKAKEYVAKEGMKLADAVARAQKEIMKV